MYSFMGFNKSMILFLSKSLANFIAGNTLGTHLTTDLDTD